MTTSDELKALQSTIAASAPEAASSATETKKRKATSDTDIEEIFKDLEESEERPKKVAKAEKRAEKTLRDASYYKRKMSKVLTVHKNLSYVADLVEKAVERMEPSMSVKVPLKIIQHKETLDALLAKHFKPMTQKLIENVSFCGKGKECEALTTGMPTETCAPISVQLSWAQAPDGDESMSSAADE